MSGCGRQRRQSRRLRTDDLHRISVELADTSRILPLLVLRFTGASKTMVVELNVWEYRDLLRQVAQCLETHKRSVASGAEMLDKTIESGK